MKLFRRWAWPTAWHLATVLLTGCTPAMLSLQDKHADAPVVTPHTPHTPQIRTLAQGAQGQREEEPALLPRTEYFRAELSEPPPVVSPTVMVNAGAAVQLDFQDADVRQVVDAVLGDMLKLTYTVAPQVQARITLRTGRPVDRTSALAALESALAAAGLALLQQGGSYQVLPVDHAARAQGALPTPLGSAVAGYAAQVLPLRYVSAREMKRILETVLPKGGVVQADDANNHLVVTGSGADRAALARTVEAFDIDSMKDVTFAFYRLEHLSAERMVAELRQVFQPPVELVGGRVRLVPLDRIQTVLGMSRNRSDLEALESWIRRLDVPPRTAERRLYVYSVQNGSAKELAASLQMVIVGERPGATSEARAVTRSAGTGVASGEGRDPAGAASRVVASEENNSLLILATESEYKLMREALSKLDILPRQVLIEAVLAEVTLGDDLRHGVQWFFESQGNLFRFNSGETNDTAVSSPGFSFVYNGRPNARVVIQALQSRTDVKILSAPRLAVMNNQKAQLQVGDEVPIRTQTSQGTSVPGSPLVSTIQMRDTGVILEITPRISENGQIVLEILQEVSDVAATTSSGIDSPTIQRRRLRSVIAARDGSTVALGGLIRENSSSGDSGVPLLKELPLLGHLFKTRSTVHRRTELLILLVPHVMRDPDESLRVAEALIRSFQAAGEVAREAARRSPSLDAPH